MGVFTSSALSNKLCEGSEKPTQTFQSLIRILSCLQLDGVDTSFCNLPHLTLAHRSVGRRLVAYYISADDQSGRCRRLPWPVVAAWQHILWQSY
jgi:hypothetical protein